MTSEEKLEKRAPVNAFLKTRGKKCKCCGSANITIFKLDCCYYLIHCKDCKMEFWWQCHNFKEELLNGGVGDYVNSIKND